MPIKSINAPLLKQWLDNDEVVLVDVREPAENSAESISGAMLLPLATISKASLPNLTGKKLVIHCRKGGRGGTACEKLLAEDPSLEIYNLEGGINAWIESGFAVKSSGKFFLPLDRQVQLTIGISVLAGSLLTYFANPIFFLVPGFFGAGLIFAGLSGVCGLAIIMAKMPWNQSTKSACCAVK